MLEPILNPTEITIPPKDRVLIRTNSLRYPENAVTGILQPSDLLHEEWDITFRPALVTLNYGSISIPVNNFTDHPYKLKKGLHIANFSVMTPEEMKYVKPVDPASTSRMFAYLRLAQGLSRSLSAFSSFMREYLGKVINADQCAQYVTTSASPPAMLITS